MHKPNALKQGDKIALIATARKVTEVELLPCLQLLRTWGLEVVLSPNLFEEEHQFAGSDTERLMDLQWAINHPELKAVLVVRGGYGTSRIIDSVDFSALKQHPKWFIGFSDLTVLLNQLFNVGIASIHGPMALLLPKPEGRESADRLQKMLFAGQPRPIQAPHHTLNKTGEAIGQLIGGNLSILHTLIATKTDVDWSGKILFIEDLDEYLYHLDRMMVHLSRAGKLKNLAGLVVGHMSDMNDNAVPFGQTALEIIHQYTAPYHFPIAFGMPIGHQADNYPVIVGHPYELEVGVGQSTLTLSNSPEL